MLITPCTIYKRFSRRDRTTLKIPLSPRDGFSYLQRGGFCPTLKWSKLTREKGSRPHFSWAIQISYPKHCQIDTIISLSPNYVEVSVQILDTPAKRKLSFRRKDNCSPRVKNRHKLYLNLKLNITSSIYRYPSYHVFFLFVFVFFLKFKALPLAFDIHS